MSEFLELVKRGNVQGVKDLYDSNPEVAYEKNERSQNAVALAVLSGQWRMAIVLLKYCRVSPHLCDSEGNSIYHLIGAGLKVAKPTAADYHEIRSENYAIWTNEEQKDRARMAEISAKNSDLKPPEGLLLKKAEDLEKLLFDPLDLFFPKYIMNKFHVVLNRKNAHGQHPSELASSVGEIELSRFYSQESEPHRIKQRLISDLNENLVRDIASYL